MKKMQPLIMALAVVFLMSFPAFAAEDLCEWGEHVHSGTVGYTNYGDSIDVYAIGENKQAWGNLSKYYEAKGLSADIYVSEAEGNASVGIRRDIGKTKDGHQIIAEIYLLKWETNYLIKYGIRERDPADVSEVITEGYLGEWETEETVNIGFKHYKDKKKDMVEFSSSAGSVDVKIKKGMTTVEGSRMRVGVVWAEEGPENSITATVRNVTILDGVVPPASEYKVTIQRYYPDDYYIEVGIWGSVTSADVIDGPDIAYTWERHAYLKNRPDIGDTFIIQIYYSDGTNEDIEYAFTDINDNFAWIKFPADGETINTTTPEFKWKKASGVSSYKLDVDEGETFIWTSGTLQAETNSITYNSNGQAISDLEGGKTYALYLHAYDQNGNSATTKSTFDVE